MGAQASITPEEAKGWLSIWTCLENAATAAAKYSRGPGSARPAPSRKVLAGRAVNKSGKGHNTLRTENNEVLSTSEDKGQALMATREDIWFQRSHHEHLLQAYAETRQHTLSTVPDVSHPLLRGVVLSAFGTGLAGLDPEEDPQQLCQPTAPCTTTNMLETALWKCMRTVARTDNGAPA